MIGESVLEIRKIEKENQLKIDQARSEAIELQEEIVNQAIAESNKIIENAKKQGQEIINKKSKEADNQVVKIEGQAKIYKDSINSLTDEQLDKAVDFVVERTVR